jgi:hypothetical protein
MSGEEVFLTKEQLDALVSALPGCKSPHRRGLLPRVLEEWTQTDLVDHLSRATPKQIRAERRQLEKLARQSDQLAQTLSGLALDCRFEVASRLLQPAAKARTIAPGFQSTQRMDRLLEECPARLQRLAQAAEHTAGGWVSGSLRPDMLSRYLVLLDLAAIFQWATDEHAGRRVRTDLVEEDAGKEYGPFYDFARAAWPMVFKSEKGLGYAIKTWASGRARYREKSPFIRNLDLRHPEWRIRDR